MHTMTVGFGLGGAWGVTWALVLTLAGGHMGVLWASGLLLIPWCMLGGACAMRLPVERLASLDRRQGLGMLGTATAAWLTTYFASHLMLTESFDLLHEIAALFATAVAGAALLPWSMNLLRSTWADQPLGRAMPVGLLGLAAFLAWVASTVTAPIVGFGWLSITLAVTSGAVATVALRALLGEAVSRPAILTPLLLLTLLSIVGGVAALHLSTETRDDAHAGSHLTHRMMVGLAGIMDGDGDGVAGGLGFTDCNDIDPGVFPGAAETPGNGRDDNCRGGDGSVADTATLWSSSGARGAAPSDSPFPTRQWNVILITLDAVRADHLSLYGYERPTSPSLDNLGKLSLVFDAAWSASNFTSLSLFSLFTGLYPSAYLGGDKIQARPGMTLTEQLRGSGYATEAIVDLHPALPHVYAGFGHIDDSLGVRAAKAVRNRSTASTANELTKLAGAAAKRLAANTTPFFLWVHYSEPHAAYLPHTQFAFGETEVDRYDSEIAFADHAVGRLLRQLHEQGRLADTIIVVTSDHGEAFGEHGVETHGQSLFEEELHIPLVIYLPKANGRGFASARIDWPLDLTDLTPTLLHAVGISPRYPVHGESLLGPALANHPLRTPQAFAETRLPYARIQALREGDTKIVVNHLTGTAWKTELGTDPDELNPVATGEDARTALDSFVDLHLARGAKSGPR